MITADMEQISVFFSGSVRACSSVSLGEEQLLTTENNGRQIKARQDNNLKPRFCLFTGALFIECYCWVAKTCVGDPKNSWMQDKLRI